MAEINRRVVLSTPSARRATPTLWEMRGFSMISIHALREEGDALVLADITIKGISIHALREEGDRLQRSMALQLRISIHALREEGDYFSFHSSAALPVFLSTPSARRATSSSVRPLAQPILFLSTPSARRATRQPETAPPAQRISIHALREEGDVAASRLHRCS